MKKTNSFFLIILLLGLFGCSNSVENTKQEISNLITSEFKVAEEKCLLEYTEDLCTSLYFTVDYQNDSNEVNIEMFKPEQSKVELLEVGTYSDISEWCNYINHLIIVNIGNFDSMTCRFDAYAKSQDQIIEITPDTLPIGELELSDTDIILEQGTAHHIKVLTPPFNTPTEGSYYNEDISWRIESEPKGIISTSTGGDINAHEIGTAIVIAESTHPDFLNAKGYAKVTVVEPSRLYTGKTVIEKLISNRNWFGGETEIPIAFFNIDGKYENQNDVHLQITVHDGGSTIYEKRDIELKVERLYNNESRSKLLEELQWILEQFISNPDDISEILESVENVTTYKQNIILRKEYEDRFIQISHDYYDTVTIEIDGKQLNPDL